MDIRDALFGKLYELAEKDERIVLLTADMGGLGLIKFRNKFPNRFYNVGIAEQNAINVATGLCLVGFRVFVYSIAAFILQRCYEQIKINLCDMQLPITIIGMGSNDWYDWAGPTHCINDRLLLTTLSMVGKFATDGNEAIKAIEETYKLDTPCYIGVGRKEQYVLKHYRQGLFRDSPKE